MSRIFYYYYIGDAAPDPLGEELGAPVLLSFSRIENACGVQTEPHTHLYTELFLFTAGQGYLSANGADISLRAGDVLLIGPEKKQLRPRTLLYKYSGGGEKYSDVQDE